MADMLVTATAKLTAGGCHAPSSPMQSHSGDPGLSPSRDHLPHPFPEALLPSLTLHSLMLHSAEKH